MWERCGNTLPTGDTLSASRRSNPLIEHLPHQLDPLTRLLMRGRRLDRPRRQHVEHLGRLGCDLRTDQARPWVRVQTTLRVRLQKSQRRVPSVRAVVSAEGSQMRTAEGTVVIVIVLVGGVGDGR